MGCPSMGCLVNDEKYLIMAELETEVKLLKKELQDQAKIHDRLDIAIEKLTDVSNSIHRMLAVHEEKIARQEEAIFEAEQKQLLLLLFRFSCHRKVEYTIQYVIVEQK